MTRRKHVIGTVATIICLFAILANVRLGTFDVKNYYRYSFLDEDENVVTVVTTKGENSNADGDDDDDERITTMSDTWKHPIITRRSQNKTSSTAIIKEDIEQLNDYKTLLQTNYAYLDLLRSIPKNPSRIRGGFVHIGKTGGSTLSLQLRNGCHSFVRKPCHVVANETIVSKATSRYFHVPDFFSLPKSQNRYYVVSVRDPLSRTLSAFTYGHALNKKAMGEKVSKLCRRQYQCFKTLESFVEYLGDNSTQFHYPYEQNEVRTTSCSNLAKAVVHGHVRPYNHFFFNHGKIKELMPTDRELYIFVTRQDHLSYDWKSINALFGQTTGVPSFVAKVRDVASLNNKGMLPVSRELSSKGVARLCKALAAEYEAYFWFLKQARNLSTEDVVEAMTRAKTNCPDLDVNLQPPKPITTIKTTKTTKTVPRKSSSSNKNIQADSDRDSWYSD